MEIETQNSQISEIEIKKFEQLINATLPKEYQKFLLKYNGGEPKLYVYNKNKQLGTIILNSLYGLKTKEKYDNLEEIYAIYYKRISNQFITIGDDPGGDQFVLGIKGDFKEKIYFWDHNEEIENDEFIKNELPKNMYYLASSFTNFIEQLEEDTEV